MTDIVEFLTARLDEDEAAAKACGVGVRDTWHTIEWYDGQFEGGLTVSVDVHGLAGTPITSRGALLRTDGVHIARHDPARVLRDVAAKRAIVADHPLWPPPEMTESELHEHRSHPDYEYATTEGQRKAWDDAAVPPEGEGWERNVDAGMPGEGWERFEFTEESYWRRLNPEGPQPHRPPLALRHLAAVYDDHPDYEQAWRVEA